jgi:transposase
MNTFTEILKLDNYKVQNILFNVSNYIAFYIIPIKDLWPKCSGCGRRHNNVHSFDTVSVKDLPISGKKVILVLKKRKTRCPEDNRIRVEEIEWLRGNVTKRFAEDLFKLTSITTNTEAGWYLGLDDEKVYRIDRGILNELALKKLNPIPSPQNISIDEVAWQKWHKYVTNVVDVDSKKVIWNSKGRGKTILDNFYKKIGKKSCKAIQSAAVDGARGYISSTKEYASLALIVYDKFHINQKLNNAIDEVRKTELKRARQNDDEELRNLTYCGERWLLLKNNNLTQNQQEKLDKLLKLNENIAKAKILKDDFLAIYQEQTFKKAEDKLLDWLAKAESSMLEPLKTLAYSFLDKAEYILNYFKRKISSAISEGINNKIKRLKRMAYGYRDPDYFLLKIHQHCGLLNPRFST